MAHSDTLAITTALASCLSSETAVFSRLALLIRGPRGPPGYPWGTLRVHPETALLAILCLHILTIWPGLPFSAISTAARIPRAGGSFWRLNWPLQYSAATACRRCSSKLEHLWRPSLASPVLGRSKAPTSPRRRPYALRPCAAGGLRSLNRRPAPSGAGLGGRYSRPCTDPGLLEPWILLSPLAISVLRRAREVPIRDLPAPASSLWRGGWYEIVRLDCRHPPRAGAGSGVSTGLKSHVAWSSCNKLQEHRAP